MSDHDNFEEGAAETRTDFLVNDFRIKRVLNSLTASAGAIKGDEASAGDIAARVDALRHLLREVGHDV
ncbi:MAG: hypothetical protein A3H97_14790 [Acidobacteria bacterium RIFCSPLOWO2_02_FULL_65_29]|nr:MAG: hypothetical protein A3H97_14790 [Acidobacteria bacterium RIFCSPLOWO2_02_FULL_65_29]